jgi:hypothetical protein
MGVSCDFLMIKKMVLNLWHKLYHKHILRKKTLKNAVLIVVMLSGCVPVYDAVPDNVPSPCVKACSILKKKGCLEGMYDMCRHPESTVCTQQINVACVMNAKSRDTLVNNCHMHCEM